jgi:hypothetical protein
MSNFQQKLSELVNSPEVKKLTDKAQAFANDPKTKEQIDKAKLKLAELRDSVSKPDGDPPAPADGTPPDPAAKA